MALAPLDGAANVTVTDGTGLPDESVTVATRGEVNALPMIADCPVPAAETIFAAAPALLTNGKLPDEAPVALATMLYDPATVFAVNAAEVA